MSLRLAPVLVPTLTPGPRTDTGAVFGPDEGLPWPELQAARLDGEVFAIDGCYSPIDECEQARHRGLALRPLMAPRFIAERLSAAWVHGALPHPPGVHEFCVSLDARVHPGLRARATLREVVITPEEYAPIGGVAVTTPLRTILDLARGWAQCEPEQGALLRALADVGGLGREDVLHGLHSRVNLPGRRRALRWLACLD